MARRVPSALIPLPHRSEIPPHDYGLDERVETAAVLLGTMYPTQVAKRLVAHYQCSLTAAYDYIARARAFLAGLRVEDRDTLFHQADEQLMSIIMNPSVAPDVKLKAIQVRIGLHGLRKQPKPAQAEEAEFMQEE